MAKAKNALEGWVSVKIEDAKIKLTARWHDKDGNAHDCGFCIAPTWDAARRHSAVLGEAVIQMAQTIAESQRKAAEKAAKGVTQ